MSWMHRLFFGLGAGAALAGGCGETSDGSAQAATGSTTTSTTSTTGAGGEGAASSNASTTSTGGAGGGTGGGETGTDPDCAVLTVLQAKCWSCHATTEHDDSDLRLVTYEDLTGPSPEEPTLTNAELAVLLMADPVNPMPPSGDVPATAEDIAAFQAWIDAGYPKADCGALAVDPYEVAAACPSGTFWNENEAPEETMHPGRECNSCHDEDNAATGGDAPIFSVAGTVYANPYAPDDCLSPESTGAEVEIVDANGVSHLVPVGPTGNFSLEAAGFAYPYTARVVFEGRERWMTTAADEADCNHCHTAAGDLLVPGRILLP